MRPEQVEALKKEKTSFLIALLMIKLSIYICCALGIYEAFFEPESGKAFYLAFLGIGLFVLDLFIRPKPIPKPPDKPNSPDDVE